MFETFSSFTDYVRSYDLQRSEGLLLRHIHSVYKVLLQTVPDNAKDATLREIEVYLSETIRFADSSLLDEWEKYPANERTHQSNQIIVRELIEAIEQDREVVACSSGQDARAALEMIMAVHESQRVKGRVEFPLANRENPYEVWRREAG